MCLAVPVLLKQRREEAGTIEVGGVEREVSLLLTPEAQEGDYVIVHAGFAISVLDRAEAEATLTLFRELADSQGQ